MTITINHTPHTVADNATVADALAECGLDGPGYAVAVGNRVIPRSEWREATLRSGAVLTVIQAVCGG